MTILVTCETQYECELTAEEEQKILDYAKENGLDIKDAITNLQMYREIDIWEKAVPTDRIDTWYDIDEIDADYYCEYFPDDCGECDDEACPQHPINRN